MYRLYVTLAGFSEAQFSAAKNSLIPIVYRDLDDALGRARQENEAGRIAWLIEGDDGTQLNRAEIREQLFIREDELVDHPRIY